MTDNSLEPWRRRSDIDGTRDEFHLELEALRASRARMVAAADAERRWIERELHDGVQQHLVALAVNVQLVRQLAGSDLAAAMAVLEEIRSDVREALDGVRALASEIYPPLLLDSGLAEALRATSANAAPKRVDAAALGRYPPAVEATEAPKRQAEVGKVATAQKLAPADALGGPKTDPVAEPVAFVTRRVPALTVVAPV